MTWEYQKLSKNFTSPPLGRASKKATKDMGLDSLPVNPFHKIVIWILETHHPISACISEEEPTGQILWQHATRQFFNAFFIYLMTKKLFDDVVVKIQKAPFSEYLRDGV